MQSATVTYFENQKLAAAVAAPGRIDLSSWISWACYAFGFVMAATPAAAEELRSGGTGAWVLAGAIAAFFVAAILIQCHMQLSPGASSFGHPSRLVTDGVFLYSRNPIYVAFLLPIASLAYFSPAAALVSGCLYVAAMTYFVIFPEERLLKQEFGAKYRAYLARVPRWFGPL